jgi:chromosome transmission fidelity protein 4
MNIFDDEAWVPVFDSRTHNKDRQESYWPVGVNEKQFYCIICKGTQKYPGFPKPILCNFPLQVPFLQLETTAGGLEEK